jgi:calcium-dependent protein kinase
MKSFRGTPYYVAPEVLDGKYAEHCDIWSFGVVMFVMLFGYPPFHSEDGVDEEIFAKIKKGFNPEVRKGYGAHFPSAITCSDDAKDLIAKCLTQDQAARPTSQEVLDHKFFSTTRSDQPLDDVMKNLRDFTQRTSLRLKVLELMVNEFNNESDIADLRATFKKFDKNGDGTISESELKEALAEFGAKDATATKFQELFKTADVDGDGSLSFEELLACVTDRKMASKEERVWKAFCELDVDNDGSITEAELQKTLGVSAEEAKTILKEVDADANGAITYDEFKACWDLAKK